MASDRERFQKEAIGLAEANVKAGKGGPFGAVIVKDDEIIGSGANEVTATNDPTAHAEIMAIRKASEKLNTFDLTGCELYTSCYPCPMCLSAAYWANISSIYYANTAADAAMIGFSDQAIYEEIRKPDEEKSISIHHLDTKGADAAFRLWEESVEKIPY